MHSHPSLPSQAINDVKQYLLDLQNQLCASLERLDNGELFKEDRWSHQGKDGGGITRVLTKGQVFAKAGINFSHVLGERLPPSATNKRQDLHDCSFEAMGVSLVLHPENPYVPTTHANVRFFVANKPNGRAVWWFGGGFDLTPYYGFIDDCRHWHQTAQKACIPFGDNLYARFKRACDDYFFLPHRNEARGIGGLFFDDYYEDNFERSFGLMQSIGNHFLPAYEPIVSKRCTHSYGEREKAFQLYRRGRYVEFNLVYDRGTLFGLQSGGRTESILMSLPPEVHWQYNWQFDKDSIESQLVSDFLIPRDWV